MYFINKDKYEELILLSYRNGLNIVMDDLGNLYFYTEGFLVDDLHYSFDNYQLKFLLSLHRYYQFFNSINLMKVSIMNEDDISEFINRSLCFGEDLIYLTDNIGKSLELFLSKISFLSTFDVIKFSSSKYKVQIVNVLCDFLFLMAYIKESILLNNNQILLKTYSELLSDQYIYLSRKNLTNILKW